MSQAPTAGSGAAAQAQTVITKTGAFSLQLATTVAAGQSVPFPVAGTNFYVISSTGTLQIQPRGGAQGNYDPGTGEDFAPQGGSFTNLQVTNPDPANAVTFTLFVGSNSFIDKRLIFVFNSNAVLIKNAPTTALGGSAGAFTPLTLGGGAASTWNGLALPNGRKQFVLHNLGGVSPGNNDTLYIADKNQRLIGACFYSFPWTIETSDTLKVYNPNIGNVSYAVGETYYNA